MEYFINLWTWQRIFALTVVVAFFLVYTYIDAGKMLLRLRTPKAIQIARTKLLITDIFVLVSIIILPIELWMRKANLDWKFWATLLSLICFLGILWNIVKVNQLLFKPNNIIMANHFAELSSEQLKEDFDVEAKKSIQKACELAPEEPRFWLVLSAQEKDIQEAKKYMNIAENLIEEKSIQSKKILGLMEFNRGNLLLAENNIELALKHFGNSLEINYDKELAAFIQRVEAYTKRKS